MWVKINILILFLRLSASAQLPILNASIAISSPPPLDTEWSLRVVSNGGVRPSQNTINAGYNFLVGLTNDGLNTKIFYANFIAPDSLIAALTPVIRQTSGQFSGTTDYPANNGNFVGGDVTVNGIKGDGSSKYFKTGCSITNFTTTSGGVVVYSYTALSGANQVCGGVINVTSGNVGIFFLTLTNSDSAAMYNETGGFFTQSSTLATNGYYSLQRTGTTTVNVYYANSFTAHASLGSSTASGGSILDEEFWVLAFGLYNPTVNPADFGNQTMSFIALTSGLSSSDDNNLFNRVQTFRQAVLGGFR